MNPINLLLPDGTPSKVWACGECTCTRSNQIDAGGCCTIAPCKACGQPSGKKFRASYIVERCDACERAERSRKDMERLEKATKLESWEGWVWDESDYYPSLDEYVEHLECNFADPEDYPDFVYVAESRPGVFLKAEQILENACDDGYDDMMDDLKGEAEFEAAIKAFNEANATLLVYDGDWSRAVRVPKPTTAPSPTEAAPDA